MKIVPIYLWFDCIVLNVLFVGHNLHPQATTGNHVIHWIWSICVFCLSDNEEILTTDEPVTEIVDNGGVGLSDGNNIISLDGSVTDTPEPGMEIWNKSILQLETQKNKPTEHMLLLDQFF